MTSGPSRTGSAAPSGFDLTTTASVAGSYAAGQIGVFIQVGVTRTGGSMPSTGPYVLDRLFWSTNPTWDGSDLQLWESNGSTPDFPVTTLNSSGSTSVTATVGIPNVSPGTYYILSVVDPTSFWSETNEGNNVAVYPVTITASGFDLTTTASVAGSYAAGQSGVFIPVGVTRTGGSMPSTGPVRPGSSLLVDESDLGRQRSAVVGKQRIDAGLSGDHSK